MNSSTITFTTVPAQGWECPKCHSIYSPTTPQCLNCLGAATNHVCDFPDDVTFPTCRICGAAKRCEFTFTTCQHEYPTYRHPPGVSRICEKCGWSEALFTNLDTNTPVMIPSVFYETPLEAHACDI